MIEPSDPTEEELRQQVMGSDLYSPMVKRVMQHFWDLLDRRRKGYSRPVTNDDGDGG
jgi:hypothetical protein